LTVPSWIWVLVVMCIFLFFSVWLGTRGNSNLRGSTADHVVAGHGLGFLAIFFISVSEFYSANTFLGAPGWAYQHGVAVLNGSMVGLLALLVMYWLGPRIQGVGKKLNLLTQAHFLRMRFNSELLGGLAAVVALCALIPYISVQIMGAGYVFNVATNGHVPFWLGGLAAYGVVAIYVFRGGLRGIGYVAVFKGIFMLIMIVVLAKIVVHKNYGTVSEMFRQIAAESPKSLTLPGAQNFFGFTWWTTSVLNGMCGYFMWPHLFSNFYAAQEGRVIKRMAIATPVYTIVDFIIIIIGFAGILIVKDLARPDQIMMRMVMNSGLPVFLVALIAAAALSASMVAGAALTLAATATLGNDLMQKHLRLADSNLKRLMQYLVFVIIGLSYLFSMSVVSTLQYIMLMAYGVISQFFPVVVAGLYWKRCTAAGALSGLLAGSVVAIFLTIGPYPHPFDIHPGIIGMLINAAILVLVSLKSDPPSNQVIESFFPEGST
jgi:SSS family solute:Na+ symporter